MPRQTRRTVIAMVGDLLISSLRILGASAVAVVAFSAPAAASTVDESGYAVPGAFGGAPFVEYAAADGEVNDLTLDGAADSTSVHGADPGASISRVDEPQNDCTVFDPHSFSCGGAVVPRQVFIRLGDGDDRYRATGAPLATALVDGGPGNDVLDTGAGGLGALGFVTGFVAGGPGDDRIDLGAGDDFANESGDAATGTENDGGGADDLRGGPGDDILTYGVRSQGVRVTFDGVADDGEPGEGDNVHPDFEELVTTEHDDRVTLAPGQRTSVLTGDGDDVIDLSAKGAGIKRFGSVDLDCGDGDDTVVAAYANGYRPWLAGHGVAGCERVRWVGTPPVPRVRKAYFAPAAFHAQPKGGSHDAAYGSRLNFEARVPPARSPRLVMKVRHAGGRAVRGRVVARVPTDPTPAWRSVSVALSGRVAGKPLPPGRYQLGGVLVYGKGRRGSRIHAGFRIVRRDAAHDVPPVASFTSAQDDHNGRLFSFFAGSQDRDGRIVRWSWDFGDGGHASGQTARHTFAAGDHKVTLTATDDDGVSNKASKVTHVEANQPPVAQLAAVAENGTVGEESLFYADGSEDPDDPMGQVRLLWNWGDGSPVEEQGRNAGHTYAAPGTYTVTLTVVDGEGATATAALQYTVIG
jgi:chitodextrinase